MFSTGTLVTIRGGDKGEHTEENVNYLRSFIELLLLQF